jgi:RNA polymerase sigma-70 factor (ECF subfamily)
LNDSALLVDHLFRHQSGRLVSTLTRIFGPRRLDLAEEVVQDALLKALELWPFQGILANPSAWLIQVAKNRALDAIRREASLAEKIPELARAFPEQTMPEPHHEFDDDQLSMMFLCCHPSLAPELRVALTLKTVAGFSAREIARAFLVQETTIAQRLVRGKRQIREQRIFNESYSAHQGESLLRADLCDEAIRLAAHPASGLPKTHALLALLLLHASRLPARVNAEGDQITPYHLQAGIAAQHALAPSYDATDWENITAIRPALSDGPEPCHRLQPRHRALALEGPRSWPGRDR